ncbi:rCG21460, isoform CRA_a [Rattus norvegicus]|uniref:RCG21460, isoform CRA_a n=1 Tax=Rattus norvegicus TaxID=10116 RepID=A6J230_RAT|nr:rCG21460, isoform CRA_a [Rattus norvegicus]
MALSWPHSRPFLLLLLLQGPVLHLSRRQIASAVPKLARGGRSEDRGREPHALSILGASTGASVCQREMDEAENDEASHATFIK